MERPARTVDEAADAVLLGLRRVDALELSGPACVGRGLVVVEEPGADDRTDRDATMLRAHEARLWVQVMEDALEALEVGGLDEVGLRDDQHVRELDLVDEQIHDRAFVLGPERDAACAQVVRGAVLPKEVRRVDHRDHRVQLGHVGEAEAVLISEGERRSDRHRLAYSCRLDEQTVEPPLGCESSDLDEKVLAQRAADAAVRHLDELLLGPTQRAPPHLHELGVDVDLAHVVDDDGDASPLAVREHVVQEGRLPSAEKAAEYGHRQSLHEASIRFDGALIP